MDDDYEQRLSVFLKKEIPVHITTKNGTWVNGYVKEVGDSFAIVDEFKYGKTIVFFSEIHLLESYTPREIKKDGK